jgi:hypothetical protein
MSSISEFLIHRLNTVFPDFDTNDPAFVAQVLGPLKQYTGEGQAYADLQKLLSDRISQVNPSWNGSALVDLIVAHVAAMLRPLQMELAAANSRRKLSDPTLLSPQDLQELRDVFLVDPDQGGFAVGVFRAYFAVPRSILIDSTNLLTVESVRGSLTYRPTRTVEISGAQMQAQRQGGQYYVDFEAKATAPGSASNLAPGEGSATGIGSAVRVVNPDRFTSGVDASSPATLLELIRSSVVSRTLASAAGLSNFQKRVASGQSYTLIQSGDRRMLRDRIYGPCTISGIPGGFSSQADSQEDYLEGGDYLSLGLAFDIWLRQPKSAGLQTLDLLNLTDEGLLLYDRDLVYVANLLDPLTGDPLPEDHAQVRSLRRGFGQFVADPSLYDWPLDYKLTVFPVRAGDVLELQGFFDPASGIRERFTYISTGYGMLRYGHAQVVSTQEPGLLEDLVGRARLRAQSLRVNLDPTDEDRHRDLTSVLPYTCVPCLSVPLRYERAKNANGTSARQGGYYVLCQPGTSIPEVSGGSYVPKTYNQFAEDTPNPMAWIDRAELLSAITQQPQPAGQKVYAYPTQILFAEFLEPRLGESSGTGTSPVRIRVHLLGPQGICFTPSCTVGPTHTQYQDLGSGDTIEVEEVAGAPVLGYRVQKNCGPYRPFGWPEVPYTVTDLEPLSTQSNRIVLTGPTAPTYMTEPLKDFSDRTVYDVYGARQIRPGDWVVIKPSNVTEATGYNDPSGYPEEPFFEAQDEWQRGTRAYPITEIENGYTLIVEAADLPNGESGVLWVMQGTSRAVQLVEGESVLGLGQDSSPLVRGGRGNEGTYSFDLFVGLADPSDDPLENEPPAYNTSATLDMAHSHAQGFVLCNPNPGEGFGVYETPSLLWPTSYLAGHALAARTVRLYGAKGTDLRTQQSELDVGGVRPILATGVVKRAPPTRVVLCLYYDAVSLSAQDAIEALEARFYELREERKIEVTDFVGVLYSKGADYVTTGRAFVLTQDFDRRWSYQASRSGIVLDDLSEIIPQTIIVRRLDRAIRQQQGRGFDELSSTNWSETQIRRYGGFTED